MRQPDNTYIENLQTNIILRVKKYEETKRKRKHAIYTFTTVFIILLSIGGLFYSNINEVNKEEINLNYLAETMDDYDIYELSSELENNNTTTDDQTIEYLSDDSYLEFYLTETP